jgi:nucleoside-diphosphate-sugar epimerase
MKEISLLGCGWLGLPLAQKLIEKKFSVKGSTTSESKMDLLQHSGIKPYLIVLGPDKIDGDIAEFLSSDILIIDIPPKTSQNSFSAKIRTLLPAIENSPIKKILFVSSISVYGEAIGIVDERTVANPDAENGRQLIEAENLLRGTQSFSTTIVRFGGLIGDDRHPVKYLSGKQNNNGDARVNLIHLEDCIKIIFKIIAQKKWGKTYNAVSPFHPTRREYYQKKATELNLPLPIFTDGGDDGKIIRAEKVIVELRYQFEKPFL